MKALTLWRPWGYIIAHHGKRIENRPWMPPASLLGRQFAIHQGKRWDKDDAWNLLPSEQLEMQRAERTGVCAVVRLVAVVQDTPLLGLQCVAGVMPTGPAWEEQGRWFCGPFGWILDEVVPVGPFECGGAQGLWTLPLSVEQDIKAELSCG